MTALITFLLLSLSGMALFVAGMYLLFGIPAALLSGSAVCLLSAAFIRRGMIAQGSK